MDCFIGEFITKFLRKKEIFKNSKEVKVFILNMQKKNQDSKILRNTFYQNKLELICNIFFETSNKNKKLQTIKEQIIIGLLMGKKIDIEKEEKK